MQFFDRPWRCPFIIIALSLIYFAPVWLHPTELIYSPDSDIVVQHYPWRSFAIDQWISHGSLPLWGPYVLGGQPFQADMQTSLFYPLHFAFLAIPAAWVAPAFGFLVWAHVVIAGLGMYLYARDRGGLDRFPSLIAAVGFMFAGKWLLHLLEAGHYVFAPLAWLPLLLWFVERAITRRLSYAAGAGLLVAVVGLGGHPQLIAYVIGYAGIVSLRLIFRDGRVADGLGRYCAAWTIAGALGFGLAAVQWLPTLEFLSLSSRANTLTRDFGREYDLIRSAGLKFAPLAILGRENTIHPWEDVGAMGVLWAGTAVGALILGWRRAVIWFHAALLGLLLGWALLPSTRIYWFLLHHIPAIGLFRIPCRALLLAGFPLGLLGGYFVQSLVGRGAISRASLIATLVWFCCLVACMFTLGFIRHRQGALYPAVMGLSGSGMIVLLAIRGRYGLSSVGSAATILVFLVADLWALHRPYLGTKPLAEVYPDNDVVRILADEPRPFRVLDFPPPESDDGFPATSPLSQGLCYLRRIESLRGTNPTDLFYFRRYLGWIGGDETTDLKETPVVRTAYDQRLLDLLGVRFLLVPVERDGFDPASAAWRFVKMLDDTRAFTQYNAARPGGVDVLPPYDLYERVDPPPRAFVVDEARPLPAGERPLETLRAVDLSRVALLESPRLRFGRPPDLSRYLGPVAETQRSGEYRPPTVQQDGPDRLLVDVERERPGFLVLGEVWYPGWRCYESDGAELPVFRADTVFRAVPLSPGRHRLRFVFDPTSYRIGWWTSATSLALLVGWAVLFGLARMRRPEPTESVERTG